MPDRSDPEEPRERLASLTVLHMDGLRIDRLSLRLHEGPGGANTGEGSS